MTDVGLASIVVGISNIFGLCFMLLAIFGKYYSWIFLLLSQGIWLFYTISEDKFDIVSLLIVIIAITALYFWRLTDFGYASHKERIIIWTVSFIAMGCCFLSPYYVTLPQHEIIFQIFTAAGLASLAFKTVDGWIWLLIANLFYWQESVSDTITVIVIGCCLYGFGIYKWRRMITS